MFVVQYPCCGRQCRLPEILDREVVERRHFCEPTDEVGTLYRVTRTVIDVADGIRVHKVEFLDMADPVAVRRYGARRIPHRTV